MKRIVLFAACFIFWCLLCWSFGAKHIIVGLFVGAMTAAVVSSLPSPRSGKVLVTRTALVSLISFKAFMLWNLVRSAAEISWSCLSPRVTIGEETIEFETRQTSDFGRTLLAIAVSFVPGLCTVDFDERSGKMLILLLDAKQREKSIQAVKKFDTLLLEIFA